MAWDIGADEYVASGDTELVLAACAFAHASATPTLNELRTLSVAGCAVASAASTPALTRTHILAVEPNVATNGNMESWASETNADEWTELLSGTSTVNRDGTEKHGGAYSVRFDLDASDSYVIMYRNFTLPAGSACRVSLWYKSTGAGHPHIKIFDSANNVYLTSTGAWSESDSFIHIAAAADWTEYALSFYAHPSYSTYRIWLTRGSGSASTSIYLDDVAIVNAPTIHSASSVPALVQQHALAVQGAAHTLASSTPTLIELRTLAVGDAALSHASATPTLIENRALIVNAAQHALEAQAIALFQAHTLVMANASIGLASGRIAVDPSAYLFISDAAFALEAQLIYMLELTESLLHAEDADPRRYVQGVDPRDYTPDSDDRPYVQRADPRQYVHAIDPRPRIVEVAPRLRP